MPRGAVLRNVRERLRDDEIGRSLRRGRESLTGCEVADEDRRHRPGTRDGLHRRHETAIEQDRGGDPAHEVADLGERLARLFLPLDDELLRAVWIRIDPLAGQAEIDRRKEDVTAAYTSADEAASVARLGVRAG